MALNLPPPPPAQFVQPDNKTVGWNWHFWFQQLQSIAGHLDKVTADSGGIISVTISGTTSNNATIAFNAEPANTFFAGPSSGGNAVPTFRSIVKADLPSTFTNWPEVKKLVDTTETCTIDVNFELTVHQQFTVSGLLNLNGEIFLEG